MFALAVMLVYPLLVRASAARHAPLSGVVRNTAGGPVSGAVVRVVAEGGAETTTDASGAFSFGDVAVPVELDVTATGYTPARVRVTSADVEVFLFPAGLTESVIVQAGLVDRSTFRNPVTGRASFRGEDVRSLAAVTLDESLRTVSGFSLFRRSSSRSANPTTHGVTMRGLSASGASRGLVVLDGTPLHDGFGGWVTWTRVPDLALASVEVTRGPQGDAFGSDAVGGVIRLVPYAAGPITLAADAGTRGVASFDASAGRRGARHAWFGAASVFDTDGTIPLEEASRGAVDRPIDVTWTNALVRAEGRREPVFMTFTAWGGRDDRGNGTALQRNRVSGGTVAVAATVDLAAGTIASTRVSFSPNRFRQTQTTIATGRVSETVNSTQLTESRATRVVMEVAHAVPRGMLFLRGAIGRASADFKDVRPTSTISRDLTDGTESLSAHVEFAPAGRLTASAGTRVEWRAAPDDAAERDRAVVGHVGASYRVTDQVTVRGAVASSHRWPTLNELVRDFQVGQVRTLSNPNLLPEQATTAEVGIAWVPAAGRLFSVTFFDTTVDDAVANVTIPSLTGIVRERRNAGTSNATGAEVDAEWTQGPATLHASATFTDATFATTAEPAIDGNKLPQVPDLSATFWAELRLPSRVSAALTWHGVTEQFDDDRNVFELASASQWGLRVARTFGAFTGAISVENLFDNRVEVGRTPLVTLAPGREVRVGVTWRR